MIKFSKWSNRAVAALAHDLVMAALSFPLSLFLRVGSSFTTYAPDLLWRWDAVFVAVAALVFVATGFYRHLWRYVSLSDLVALLRVASLVVILFFVLVFVINRSQDLPRSLIGINWLVLLALLGGPRFVYRSIRDRGVGRLFERESRSAIPVLLIGAREGAAAFIADMSRDRDHLYRIVGIVSDQSQQVGGRIVGAPVLGLIEDMPRVVAALDREGKRPQRLIIAERGFNGAEVGRLLDMAENLTIPLARLPRLTEFQDTADGSEKIAPVAIEDLLGRSQAVLDRPSMRALIAGRRVMITGAGGTIGSELARQIAAFAPSRIALLDNGEYALYVIDKEIATRFAALPRTSVIADVRDRARIDEIFAAERPELVFHAAAMKHVSIVEQNPLEGVLTNVFGTRHVGEACRAHGVAVMVMISTDKAVNPASVMGATKRLAECICQALDLTESGRPLGTRFVTVRFGNVLGSTGSVVPLFQRQLAAGGPLTVTHPEVSRFFMTVREAVELVLQAAILGAADPSVRGRLFVLDMGEAIKIVDLARQMIRLAGRKPDQDVKIEFIGLRDGEKLEEELFHSSEPLVPTAAPGIRLAAPRTMDYAMLAHSLEELHEQARTRQLDRVFALLSTLVPEFQQHETAMPRSAPAIQAR